MATLDSRLLVLEQSLAKAVQRRPVPFFRLPAVGDPHRADVLADIAKRVLAGRACIIYEIV